MAYPVPLPHDTAGKLKLLTALVAGFIVLAILVNYLRIPYSNTSGLMSYEDPVGRFSFDYPNGWRKVTPTANNGGIAFESRVWGFKTDPSYLIIIAFGPYELSNGSLTEYYYQFVNSSIGTDPNFQVIRSPKYTNYKIDGYDTASWVYRATERSKIVDTLVVVSLTNGTAVTAKLVSDPDALDRAIQLFNKTVSRINVASA